MDQIKEKQIQIQVNQTLKNITWKESGIPTLTQQAISPKKEPNNDVEKTESYPDDFILDFDTTATKDNGHQLDCTCKVCVSAPKNDKVQTLAAMKAEPCLHPLNKRRF
ncbi:MAG: hypothetical protein JXR16_10605 [Bermanella sp.]